MDLLGQADLQELRELPVLQVQVGQAGQQEPELLEPQVLQDHLDRVDQVVPADLRELQVLLDHLVLVVLRDQVVQQEQPDRRVQVDQADRRGLQDLLDQADRRGLQDLLVLSILGRVPGQPRLATQSMIVSRITVAVMSVFRTTHLVPMMKNLVWVLTGRITGTCWWRKGHRGHQVLKERQVQRVLRVLRELQELQGRQDLVDLRDLLGQADLQVPVDQVGHQVHRGQLELLVQV